MTKFSIGTDPEFFLQNEQGQIVSSIPYLLGTKYVPIPLATGGGLSRDNVALEFFTPPKTTKEEFISVIRDSFIEVYKQIPFGFEIVPKAAHTFERHFLTHPEAKRFGCDPDFNAWTMQQNIPASSKTSLRSCGAHIHVGYFGGEGFEFLEDGLSKIEFVRLLDATIGMMSVIMDNSESSKQRKTLYGKAGCHRPTSYGIEYRVLSNFWLTSPRLVDFVFKVVERTLMIKECKEDVKLINSVGSDIINESINNGNVEVAKVALYGEIFKHVGKDIQEEFESMCNLTFEFKKEWRI